MSDTLNVFDNSETRTPTIIVESYQDTVGALCADDYKGANRQYVDQDKLIISPPPIFTEARATAYSIGNGQVHDAMCPSKEVSKTLNCMEDPMKIMIAKAVDLTNLTESDTNGALQASMAHNTHSNNVIRRQEMETEYEYAVRRLTPLECTRLQGYPDGWVDIGEWVDSKGKTHKDADAPKYKALGNSIALPFWKTLFENMSQFLPHDATLGSLFDGIGGFPLCFEEIYGKGSARWASEIEEFPIAVTKLRFPETE